MQQSLDPQQRNIQEKEVVRLLTLSVRAMRRGDTAGFRDAEAALGLARELKPGDPRIYDGLGCLAFRRGNLDLAEYFFKKALERDLLYDRAYAHLALIAQERGDIESALELLKIAVETNPTNYRSRNNLAALMSTYRIDPPWAFQELLKAVETQQLPDSITAHNLEILEAN